MSSIHVRIVSKSIDLPPMECNNFFHSVSLFKIAETTPGHKPYMMIAEDETGQIVAHMLALVRWHTSWLPPYLYSQGRIYGEGEYVEGIDKEATFGLLLKEVTRIFKRNLVLYTEFSDISHKMFGYKHFRENKYFPISWQEIHNSLHSKQPELRLGNKTKKQIKQAKSHGIVTREVEEDSETHLYYRLLNQHFKMKFRRYIPSEKLFRELQNSQHAKTFITLYKDKIIGGCSCVYSEGNAYLWYLASKRKTYRHLHPDTATVWNAIEYAYQIGCRHIYFLDAGLPFRKSHFREFILSFGGMPVTKYRWFRITIPRINHLMSWLCRE